MNLLFLGAGLVVIVTGGVSGGKKYFRVAVLEAIHLGQGKDIYHENPYEFVNWNLDCYSQAAKEASKEGVDIVVLPENSVISAAKGLRMKEFPQMTTRSIMRIFAEMIPDPELISYIPCQQKRNWDTSILRKLSCIARDNNIYLVATLPSYINCTSNCSDDEFLMYNTQVAFDRRGNLVSRYHKFHLYSEPYFNMPAQQEFSFFDTDFGARIGLFICFDRLFKEPLISLIEKHNVTTMALSTLFYDGYPFLMSHQIDQSWSQRLRINILSSNQKNPSIGTTGSGIYSPDKVAIYEHDSIKEGSRRESVLLIASVPVDPKANFNFDPDPKRIKIQHSSSQVSMKNQKYSFFEAALTDEFVTADLESISDDIRLCSKGLCCRLQYKMKNWNTGVRYIFAVASRMKTFTSGHMASEEQCMLVAYDREKLEFLAETDVQFSRIKISSKTFTTRYIYKSGLESNFRLIPQHKIIYGNESLEIVDYVSPILLAGLYGRCYERDPVYVQFP